MRDKTANLSLADVKARQSSKIREIGEALVTTGLVSLDAQAKVLGLPRSTAWTILSAEHKSTGISARIVSRMLSSERLPQLVRAKNHGIRGGKSSRYLRWDEDAASQICLEAQIERPRVAAHRPCAFSLCRCRTGLSPIPNLGYYGMVAVLAGGGLLGWWRRRQKIA